MTDVTRALRDDESRPVSWPCESGRGEIAYVCPVSRQE